MTRGVRDHLRGHPIAFEDLGEQKVKNIAQPVRAFRVRMGEAPDELIDPVLEATRVDGPSMAPLSIGEDVDVELAFWHSIKDSGSVAELDAYLHRYPDGPFSSLALTRRDALTAADESATPAKEDILAVQLAFWEAAKDSGSRIELEAYLERYPDGEFVELAQARLESLGEPATDLAARNGEVSEGEITFESATPAKEDILAVQLAFWEAAKDSGSRIELEAYLERYPDGEFVELAQARLESLREPATDLAAPNGEVSEGELTFWNSIKDSGNPDMFRAYLNKYPDGTYAELAQINIDVEVP